MGGGRCVSLRVYSATVGVFYRSEKYLKETVQKD